MTLAAQLTLELIRMLAGTKASTRGLACFQEGAGGRRQPSCERGATMFRWRYMLPSTRG